MSDGTNSDPPPHSAEQVPPLGFTDDRYCQRKSAACSDWRHRFPALFVPLDGIADRFSAERHQQAHPPFCRLGDYLL
jgi:hypothetical protein